MAHVHTTNINLPKRFSPIITHFVSSWLPRYCILIYNVIIKRDQKRIQQGYLLPCATSSSNSLIVCCRLKNEVPCQANGVIICVSLFLVKNWVTFFVIGSWICVGYKIRWRHNHNMQMYFSKIMLEVECVGTSYTWSTIAVCER